jgi:tRNA uridine 5-carbamoylmethylation protein Kti12
MPASGKTTWVETTFKGRHVIDKPVILSSDDYIEKKCAEEGLTYNEGFQRFIDEAQAHFMAGFCSAIKARKSFLIDRTNLTLKGRRKLLSQIPNEYKKVAIVFHINDYVEYYRRLNSRPGKTIPQSVIDNMLNSFTPPTEEEGFSSITSLYV